MCALSVHDDNYILNFFSLHNKLGLLFNTWTNYNIKFTSEINKSALIFSILQLTNKIFIIKNNNYSLFILLNADTENTINIID